MPNPDYSYAGFNPGQGMSDFAQTMRQGWADQQALRQHQAAIQQQQFQNLLNTQQHEAEYGPVTGQSIVNPDVLGSGDVTQGAQKLVGIATQNRAGPQIYDARSGNFAAGGQQGSQPQATAAATQTSQSGSQAPNTQAQAAQAGLAPASGPQDLHDDKSEPGLQSDGRFVAKSGAVVAPDIYKKALQSGGSVNPETGAITLPNYVAHNYMGTFNKEQSALATIGARALGGLGNQERAQVIQPDRAKKESSLDWKKDPEIAPLWSAYQHNEGLANSAFTSPETRNAAAQGAQALQAQIQALGAKKGLPGFGGGRSAPVQAASTAPQGKIKVSNGKSTFMIDPSHLSDAQKDGFHQVQ